MTSSLPPSTVALRALRRIATQCSSSQSWRIPGGSRTPADGGPAYPSRGVGRFADAPGRIRRSAVGQRDCARSSWNPPRLGRRALRRDSAQRPQRDRRGGLLRRSPRARPRNVRRPSVESRGPLERSTDAVARRRRPDDSYSSLRGARSATGPTNCSPRRKLSRSSDQRVRSRAHGRMQRPGERRQSRRTGVPGGARAALILGVVVFGDIGTSPI